MNIIIGDKVYDSQDEPIVICFKDDEERKLIANQLTNMEEKDSFRLYAMFPEGYNGQELIDKVIEKLNNA